MEAVEEEFKVGSGRTKQNKIFATLKIVRSDQFNKKHLMFKFSYLLALTFIFRTFQLHFLSNKNKFKMISGMLRYFLKSFSIGFSFNKDQVIDFIS
jgi:hypothetical protein